MWDGGHDGYSTVPDLGDLHVDGGAPYLHVTSNETIQRLPGDGLDAAFATEAAELGLVELKGHRSVGGIRASIYNAMPLEGVRELRGFMEDFRSRNG